MPRRFALTKSERVQVEVSILYELGVRVLIGRAGASQPSAVTEPPSYNMFIYIRWTIWLPGGPALRANIDKRADQIGL